MFIPFQLAMRSLYLYQREFQKARNYYEYNFDTIPNF